MQIPSQVDSFAGSNIFVPLSTPSHSEVIITATVANNGSYVRCFVEEFGKLAVLNCSGNATLKVYGEFSSHFFTVSTILTAIWQVVIARAS